MSALTRRHGAAPGGRAALNSGRGIAALVRRAAPTVALGLLLTLGACRLPQAADHAALHIAADGALTLDGQPVTLATLGATVQARHRGDIPLEVEITASPLAPMTVVNQVVHTSTAAHATVAFAEISAASTAASGTP